MRKLGIAATLAASVLPAAAGSAQAERLAPEFGRCVKAARGETGAGYSDPGCTRPVTSAGKFHWLAGPGSKTTGEFTGAAAESVALTLTGCKMSSQDCQSPGAATGEVAFSPLEGTPVVVRTSEKAKHTCAGRPYWAKPSRASNAAPRR